MGGGDYSAIATRSFLSKARASGTSYTKHNDDIHHGIIAAQCHETLSPSKLNSFGKLIRESLDSEDHPTSLPIVIGLDVTGSNAACYPIVIEKMPNLMELLVDKGVVEHPHIMIAAVGDEQSDKVPLQISQFESDDRINVLVRNIYAEGGGGGQSPPSESYQLLAYFLARHSEIDSLNKRGKKGYCFIVGDELPKTHVRTSVVKEVFGETIEANIPTQQIFDELREKYEVFWIRPANMYLNLPVVTEGLKALVGERILVLSDSNNICELVALTIATNEGATMTEAKAKLASSGATPEAIAAAEIALIRVNRKGHGVDIDEPIKV